MGESDAEPQAVGGNDSRMSLFDLALSSAEINLWRDLAASHDYLMRDLTVGSEAIQGCILVRRNP
jgi:hypothetical protein